MVHHNSSYNQYDKSQFTEAEPAGSIFENKDYYKQIFQNNPAVQILIDPGNGNILDVNDAACRFYGYSYKSFTELSIFDINTLSRDEIHEKMVQTISERGSSFLFPHQLADGSMRKVQVFSTPIHVNGHELLYSTIHDITELLTEKQKAQESAQKLKEQRERLASKIETIEEERRKISRELHDGVGQMLTAAFLNLEVLENAVENQDDNALEILHKIRKLLDTTIQETRNISHNLRPSILDDFGLIPGLRMLAEEFSEATGISAIFQHFNFDVRLEPRMETTLYRICQEALNNIARHSGASEATIEIFRRSSNILVSINDNGKGIPKNYRKNQNFRAGTGLNNIKERIELYKGKLSINTMNKSGTELLIEFPVET